MALKRILSRTVAASLLVGANLTPALAADDSWDWMVAPYLWATTIQSDFSARGQPVDTAASFSDIVDKLDFAAQLHVEGQDDQFGILADYTFMGLSDDSNRDAFAVDVSLDTTIFELAAVWSPGAERFSGFEALAGIRYLDTKVDLKFDLANPVLPDQRRTLDSSYTDVMIGARYTAKLTDRWGLTLRGDASFGDTEGGYNASAIVQYHTERGAWAFGYRYMNIELEQSSGEAADLTMLGPIVGYGFKF